MKNTIRFIVTLFMLVFLGMPLASSEPAEVQTKPTTARVSYFKLNTRPESPERQVNWQTELPIVLSEDSPRITIGGANGTKSSGILPAGVLVITDERTKTAKWVAICGNTVHTDWVPKGKPIFFRERYQDSCEEMKKILAKLDSMDGKLDILVGRPTLTRADLDAAFAAYVKDHPPTKEGPKPPGGNWYTRSWRDHPFITGFVHGAIIYLATNKKGGSSSGTPPGGSTGPGK